MSMNLNAKSSIFESVAVSDQTQFGQEDVLRTARLQKSRVPGRLRGMKLSVEDAGASPEANALLQLSSQQNAAKVGTLGAHFKTLFAAQIEKLDGTGKANDGFDQVVAALDAKLAKEKVTISLEQLEKDLDTLESKLHLKEMKISTFNPTKFCDQLVKSFEDGIRQGDQHAKEWRKVLENFKGKPVLEAFTTALQASFYIDGKTTKLDGTKFQTACSTFLETIKASDKRKLASLRMVEPTAHVTMVKPDMQVVTNGNGTQVQVASFLQDGGFHFVMLAKAVWTVLVGSTSGLLCLLALLGILLYLKCAARDRAQDLEGGEDSAVQNKPRNTGFGLAKAVTVVQSLCKGDLTKILPHMVA